MGVMYNCHMTMRLKYIDIIASSALLDDFVQNFLDEYKDINPKKYEKIRGECTKRCTCCEECKKAQFDKGMAVVEIIPKNSYKELGLENVNLYDYFCKIRDIRNSIAHRGSIIMDPTYEEEKCSELTDEILLLGDNPLDYLDGLSVNALHNLFEIRFLKLKKLMEITDYDNPEVRDLLFGEKGNDYNE